MMYPRTFKQMGIAFGSQPLEITAKVDNVVVYQGTVVTLNEPAPSLPNPEYSVTNELFSWTAPVNFEGPQVIEIIVGNGAELLVADLTANYTPLPGDVANTIVSSGADGFEIFRWEQFGNTYINGVLQEADSINHSELTGPWWWVLAPGSDFVENINVAKGLLPQPQP